MPVNHLMPASDAGATSATLRVFSCYGDVPASVRARRTAAAIARLAGPHWRTTSEMWRLDSLQASAPIREMIANDAEKADVLIIAVGSLGQSEHSLPAWFDALKTCKSNGLFSGLLIGLLGDDEINAAELDRLVKPLMQFARVAERDFIWHRMDPGVTEDTDWMAESVQALLSRKLWFEVFGRALRLLAARPHLARPLPPAGTPGADPNHLAQDRA